MSDIQKLKELVHTFGQHLDDYKRGYYNETQVRVQYIDPLFKLLGWDVHNEAGNAEAYKDVIHEDSIKIGGATKAPDYCFRVGGTRKFFLEAKKPSVYIKEDPAASFQLRRYGYSAKLPLSILTDFEEFAVYDTRIKPVKNDKVSRARIDYLTFDQYPDQWDDLCARFSKDAVYKGAFDKYVESQKIKKGTAQVDSTLLEEIETWRDALARNIALRNPGLTSRDLNFAVQAVIDRIVFLRMCEDRGIETYGRLQGLQNGNDVYPRLCNLFRQADDRYNSGLFHFNEEKNRATPPDDLTLGLQIDDKVLKNIFKNLYYPDSPYEFSVLPIEILGEVYEQFLGKVIRVTGKSAKVEEKPEVKKAGGVYYTPKYIVDYIVENTVGELLKGKKPGKAVDKIKILDPACGSGSFLIGAYDYLLNWYREQYAKDAKKHKKKLYLAQGKEWRLTTEEKKRILVTHIHGVDIDPQAVEVTKLSLLLKVLEGESDETLNNYMKLFHERALPDLGDNIKCGNSLIGPDFYQGQQMALLDKEDRYRINAFDWSAEFKEIMESGGFDAVIGNPPYVIVSNEIFSKDEMEYLKNFQVAQYKFDLFHLFLQKGIDLLNDKGLMGYIIPNPWLTLKFTTKLREYILKNIIIREIVIFDHLVFKAANVYTCLAFFEKDNPNLNHLAKIKKNENKSLIFEINSYKSHDIKQDIWVKSNDFLIETRASGKDLKLVEKIKNNQIILKNLARASLGCQAYNKTKHTPEQINNRVFHSDFKKNEKYLPELAGKDVSRYSIKREKGKWIKYGPWLHDYRTIDWLQGPRILIREIPNKGSHKIHGCFTEEVYCNYKTILNVNPSSDTNFSMKYLLGLINSKLISYLYPFISNKLVADSFPRISVGDLRNLPICRLDLSNPEEQAQHDRMVELVERMLDLNQRLDGAKTAHDKNLLERQITATDNEIDQLVYQLYGLTDDEIALVEASTQ